MSTDKLLRILLPSYFAASLLHFSHNAEYLDSYPNLPPWITHANVYFIWLGMTAAGCLGFVLYRKRRSPVGLVVLGLYALAGLGGLLHYTRAPFSAHTAAMNFTILLEAASSVALLAVTVIAGCQRGSRAAT